MSFSLRVFVEHPDGYASSFDIVDGQTYNLAPMWCKALGIKSTRDLDGKDCADLRPLALAGFVDIQEHVGDYEALNPANGWGDFEGFEETFTRFVKLVLRHPTGRISWSG